jgi:hypothetical protein
MYKNMGKKLLSTFLMLVLFALSLDAIAAPPQIQASQCGVTLAAMNTTINATQIPGATAYRFKVTTTGANGQEQILDRPSKGFALTMLGSYAYATTYYIQVAVKIQNTWQSYGPQCSVTSPSPRTKIQTSQCGITLSSISNVIYANTVSQAPGYRFRITNVVNPLETFVVDRLLREFRMNLIPAGSGVTYAVEVAVKNFDGSYLPFGEPCSVTTPVLYTKVKDSQCGNVLGAMSDEIFANLVTNAQGYRFKITKLTGAPQVTVINRALRVFAMNQLTGILYNTPYRIEVSIKDPHGDYLAYGPACTVITPGLPIPKIQLSQCDLIAANNTDLIYADEFPGSTMYRFRLENPEVGYSHYIDRAARSYNLGMFTGLQAGTAYTVKVAVKVNGNFSAYGKACNVTTPGSASQRVADNGEDIQDKAAAYVYPNPFSDVFSINASFATDKTVAIKVFDMMGRVLDSRNISARDLQTLEMGGNYPPGIYNVTISSDGETKMFRVVKK